MRIQPTQNYQRKNFTGMIKAAETVFFDSKIVGEITDNYIKAKDGRILYSIEEIFAKPWAHLIAMANKFSDHQIIDATDVKNPHWIDNIFNIKLK